MRTDAVVVCAFGPATVTRAAVTRARRLLSPRGRVVVFPATRLARDPVVAGLARLRAPDVDVVDDVGRAGALAALARCGPGPVLYVHDDVAVPLGTLRRLTDAAASGRVAVPYSNDNGVDGAIGALPVAARAAGDLRRAAQDPRLVERAAVTVRPSCLVADVATLRGLVDHHIASARTVLSDPVHPFVLAAGAVVAHDGGCATRLLAPEGPDGRPLLVASMIVRDEEALLGDCLASLDGLVDRVEVCDTGSTDATVPIARAAGAHVTTHAWRDDFADARNAALERCRDAWFVLHVDADERADCPDPALLRRRLATAVDDHRAFRVEITNVAGDADENGSTFRAKRIFNPHGVRFVGALHEMPEDVTGAPLPWSTLEGLRLRHLGYREDIIAGRDKGHRNTEIARLQYETDPTAPAALNYARSLALAGQREDLQVELYEQVVADGHLARSGQASVLANLADLALRADDPQRALDRAAEALELVPADDRAAEFYGRAAEALGRPDLVLDMTRSREGAVSVEQMMTSAEQRTRARSREVAAHALLGRPEEALDAALGILADAPAGFDAWPELVAVLAATRPTDAAELLVPAAVHDADGACFDAVVRGLPPAATAEFCLRYCDAGGTLEEAVRVGLVAALLRGREDLFTGLLAHADRLHPEIRARIADRAEARGDRDAAAGLRATVPPAAAVSARATAASPADALSRLRDVERLRANPATGGA